MAIQKVRDFQIWAHWCKKDMMYVIFVAIPSGEGRAICSHCGQIYPPEYFDREDTKHPPKFIEESALKLADDSDSIGEWLYSD